MAKEHNKSFYSSKEIKRILEVTKEFEDGEELYYYIGALRYAQDRWDNLIQWLESKNIKYLPNNLAPTITIDEVLDYIRRNL